MEEAAVSKNFIEQIIEEDIREGHCETVRTRFPAGTERLSPYWTRQIYFIELWPGGKIQWEVPYAF